MATEFDEGMLVGVLIGEGHFGGDGKQPQVTLRMHTRHLALFRWIDSAFPGGKLYGPYNHGGRHYYQWMARGQYLREVLLPILERRLTSTLDGHSYERYQEMKDRYASRLFDGDGRSKPAGEMNAKKAASRPYLNDQAKLASVDQSSSLLDQASALFDALRHHDH